MKRLNAVFCVIFCVALFSFVQSPEPSPNASPTSATITLLTPAGERIAGDTIVAIVTISNANGLVSGQNCYVGTSGVLYRDTFGIGATLIPTVTTGSGSGIINTTLDATNLTPECFANGVDTVKFVLYQAPYNTTQRITVSLNGLTATTGPFQLLPSKLASLHLESVSGNHLIRPDTLVYPNDHTSIFSVGYDKFANKIGRINSNWSFTQTVTQLGSGTGMSQIFLDASTFISSESGYVYARSPSDSSIVDSIFIVIEVPPASLDSALTRDSNGNGYLDRIDLYYNRLVNIPADFTMSNIMVSYGTEVFKVDSIGGIRPLGETERFFSLFLHEDSTGLPQTAWKPLINVSAILGSKNGVSYQTMDGAGPVIWNVVKTINSPTDRTQDEVTVTFSEPIGTNGNNFSLALSPSSLFRVWERSGNGADTFVEVSGMLDGIQSFNQLGNNGSSVSFIMSNAKDLTVAHYLSLRADTTEPLTDLRANSPIANNRRVQVLATSAGASHLAVVGHLSPKLRLSIPTIGIRTFVLPPNIAHKKLSLSLYAVSGNLICKLDGISLDEPVPLSSPLPPGIYLLTLRSSDRQLTKDKFVIFR